MLRSRLPRRIALVLAALAILLGVPVAAHHAARQDTARQPISAVTVADRSPLAPSGVCSVPGIGDIGSLFGLCQAGESGITGDLNSICEPSLPSPELASAGIDSMVKPAAAPGPQNGTLYDNYGVAGPYWAATNLKCSDMTALIGNNVASMVFDIAKSIDRVIISVYQSAAGEGILSWLTAVIDKLISSLGNAIYFPYLAVAVIIGAMWLAWQGLIRKRGTRTIEGTIWMVVACVAAIWLIGRPADFTGVGRSVSDGISQTLNVAFSKLPSPGSSGCLPVQKNDPQVEPVTYNYTSGNGVVDQDANELWTVLVCKPWLDGEFGTTNFAATAGGQQTPVNTYGRQLLWAQAVAVNEKPTAALIQAKQSTYQGIANSLQNNDPGVYPLFQGKQWTTRLEIAFAALFAATVAGLLVLLIAVTLILLKLGFLLLLVVGPFFLLIGMHPGFGRVIALRWFEMLVGVLLKQAAVALVLSVLLYAYSLIMGTSDAVLPWALKILMIALVTVAVFIYRKPFGHLFSAVGYGMIGSTERAELSLGRAWLTARGNTLTAAAAVGVPGFAAYRAARWARRNPAQADGLGTLNAARARIPAGAGGTDGAGDADLPDSGLVEEGGVAASAALAEGARPAGRGARARVIASSGTDSQGRTPPPLNLRTRPGTGPGGLTGTEGTSGTGSTTVPGPVPVGSGSRPAALAGGSPPAGSAPVLSSAGPGGPATPPLPNGQPRPAGPTSAWPGASARQSLGGSRPAQQPPLPPPARPASGVSYGSQASGSQLPGPPPARPAPPPARQAPPPARQAPPPASPASSRPSPWSSGRSASPPPARPAGPAPAPPPARSPAPPSARPAAQPPAAPARSPAPPPARSPAPPPAPPARSPGSAACAPARPGSAAARPRPPGPRGRHPAAAPPEPRRPGWTGDTASRRQAAAAPPARSAPPAEQSPAGTPLAGHHRADREEPLPFWLRPLRRRK